MFREGAANNTVLLRGVKSHTNRAQFGVGVFLAFFDNASSNTVTIDNCEVIENQAIFSKWTISE